MPTDLVDNPAWLTTAISDVYDVIQKKVPAEWLPLLTGVKGQRGRLVGQMKEYGCGAYGCVIPTLDRSVVLKATTDTTETEFAAKLSSELVVPCVVEYYMVVALSARVRGRRISLLWRESADHVGDIDRQLGKNGGKAEKLIDAQHAAAKRVLLAIKAEAPLDHLLAQWVGTLDKMAAFGPLAYVANGMKRVWLEQRVFLGDTHAGNLGQCMRDGKKQWVITDPGNVIVMTS